MNIINLSLSTLRATCCLLLLFATLLYPLPGNAETPVTAAPDSTSVVSPVPLLPGLSEVQPTKAVLLRAAAEVQSALQNSAALAGHITAVLQLREQQKALQQQITELGALDKWSSDRLVDIRQVLESQRLDQQKRLELISAQAAMVEQQTLDWQARQDFWQRWEKSLASPLARSTSGAFRESLQSTAATLAALSEHHQKLVALQQQIASLLDAGRENSQHIAEALDLLRRDLLRKSATALYSPHFFAAFDSGLLNELRQGLQAAAWTRPDFYSSHSPLFTGQLFILLLIFFLIRRYRDGDIAEEWRFLTARPLAAALFAAFAGPGLFYVQPPSLVGLVVWVLTLGSAAFLLPGLLKSRRLLHAFYLLLGVEFGKGMLEALFIPLPVQRLYHVITCLLIALLFWRLIRQDRPGADFIPRNTVLLRLAAIPFTAAAIAQTIGYGTLGFWISTLSVNTLFTAMLLLMTITLGRGAIDFLIKLATLAGWRFFIKHGAGLARRLKLLLQLWLLFEGGLYILIIWRLFPNRELALSTLTGFGVSIGNTPVTIGMLLWAAVVMLLTFQISWLTRSLVDTTLFHSRRTDRGVRDAVRKLIHYSFLAVGVLLALTTAGVDARVFAVVGGAFGIGIGFGLQNIVSNFISGIILLFERPIKAGDTVVLDGEWGTVKSIGLRSTVVETLDNSEIIVPNSLLISEKVTNWTLSTAMARVVLPVGVAYGSDIGQVLEILKSAATAHPLVLQTPAVSAIFTGFGDSSLDFELRVFIADIQERLRVRSDILQSIAAALATAGIEIPFPQRDLHLRSIDAGVADRLQSATPIDKGTVL